MSTLCYVTYSWPVCHLLQWFPTCAPKIDLRGRSDLCYRKLYFFFYSFFRQFLQRFGCVILVAANVASSC